MAFDRTRFELELLMEVLLNGVFTMKYPSMLRERRSRYAVRYGLSCRM